MRAEQVTLGRAQFNILKIRLMLTVRNDDYCERGLIGGYMFTLKPGYIGECSRATFYTNHFYVNIGGETLACWKARE
jgi:hypothetical protein